jgi:hypothetical protein
VPSTAPMAGVVDALAGVEVAGAVVGASLGPAVTVVAAGAGAGAGEVGPVGEVATMSWMGCVVPSETVSWAAGEAKECQSNVTNSDVTDVGVEEAVAEAGADVTDSGVAVAIAIVKPEVFLSVIQ